MHSKIAAHFNRSLEASTVAFFLQLLQFHQIGLNLLHCIAMYEWIECYAVCLAYGLHERREKKKERKIRRRQLDVEQIEFDVLEKL